MKELYRLFNRRRDQPLADKKITGAVPAGAEAGTAPSAPAPVGGFITKESLVSFPGATIVISVVWGFINYLAAPTGRARDLIGIAICLVIGLFMYWINTTDPDAPVSPRDKTIGLFVALLNTIVLFMASFGTQVVIGTRPP